ncbi:hypothetical protein NHX12_033909 [Muraenolepis orangiensis]|uniref:Uncharacterized protein n=1 Tax=Muraenolepis orangiensis TaxID=630683 RepID=A0A9Q0E8L3_9TELE|nr:hypothetical protein NHX12_033909 [Muraenolepis orangiensis]
MAPTRLPDITDAIVYKRHLSDVTPAAPSPVMGNMPPNDGMPGGPMPPGFFQPRTGQGAAAVLPPGAPSGRIIIIVVKGVTVTFYI